MNNKEAIYKIKDYLFKQDHADVCYLAASLMIDLNRIYHIDELPNNEREVLKVRLQANVLEIKKFLGFGDTGEGLKIYKLNSDDLQ